MLIFIFPHFQVDNHCHLRSDCYETRGVFVQLHLNTFCSSKFSDIRNIIWIIIDYTFLFCYLWLDWYEGHGVLELVSMISKTICIPNSNIFFFFIHDILFHFAASYRILQIVMGLAQRLRRLNSSHAASNRPYQNNP